MSILPWHILAAFWELNLSSTEQFNKVLDERRNIMWRWRRNILSGGILLRPCQQRGSTRTEISSTAKYWLHGSSLHNNASLNCLCVYLMTNTEYLVECYLINTFLVLSKYNNSFTNHKLAWYSAKYLTIYNQNSLNY